MRPLEGFHAAGEELSPSSPPFLEDVIDVKLTTQTEALFVSNLQPSDHPTLDQVASAIKLSLQTRGVAGCAEVLAAEYGAHPEEAARRMRWARSVVAGCCATIAA
jgi:hypothetical protein